MRPIDADALIRDIIRADCIGGWNPIIQLIYYAPTIEISSWIPCSVRLPEQDGCYLVTVAEYGNEQLEVDEAGYINGEWYTVDGEVYSDWYKGSYITAWMPEPEPYREQI